MSLLGRLVRSLRERASAAAGRAAAARECLQATHLLQRGDAARAGERFAAALQQDPSSFAAHSGIGIILLRRGERARALHHLGRALELDPRAREVALLTAQLLRAAGRARDGLAALAGALAAYPEDPLLGVEQARLLRETGELEAARQALEQLCSRRPDDLAALEQLAIVWRESGEAERALEAYARLAAALPEHGQAASTRLFHHLYRAHDRRALFAAHVAWGERFAAHHLASREHANDPAPERALRIGYVSADFGRTSAAPFIEPLLACHDSGQFSLYCYHASQRDDEVKRRFEGLAHAWREVADVDDEALCRQVRQDQIDILIDLNGHTKGHRLTAFARKPAPVQMTYLGYCGTTGVAAIDYRITDARVDPPGEAEAFFTETLLRLPGSMWCFSPPRARASLGERASSGFTFGSFNHVAKLSPHVLDLWAQIARRLPHARFLLAGVPEGTARSRIIDIFSARQVDPRRLEFHARRNSTDYYALFREVDVALDSYPYNGGATTCDALWMGVPVLSLAGRGTAERSGASLLAAAGLADWVAATPEEYVERACAAAGQPEHMRELRAQLHGRIAGSPLCDGRAFMAGFESVLRQAWHAWCRRQSAVKA